MAPTAPHPFAIPHRSGDDYATWYINQKTDELVGHFGISECEREDVKQELVLDLLQRWPNYDPDLSKPRTFIAKVIRHRISTIIRHRMSEQQVFEELGHIPIDETIEEESKECRRTAASERLEQDLVDLEDDVEVVLAGLPPELREIAERLRTESKAETARQLGIPESTVRYRVGKIRIAFEKAGLRDHLSL